jgi:hypothetical protein
MRDEYDIIATPAEAVAEWGRNVSAPLPDECRCRGGGWMLHDYDVWVSCRFHYNGQPHPEFDWDE